MTDMMRGPTRRRRPGRAIAVGMAMLVAAVVTAGPALGATSPPQAGPASSLVPPTGHFQMGTVRLHLVDPTRIDPPQLGPAAGLTPGDIQALVGTIDPTTAVTDERVYTEAFFDEYLRGRDDHLLDGNSPCYPDVTFEP